MATKGMRERKPILQNHFRAKVATGESGWSSYNRQPHPIDVWATASVDGEISLISS